jgi:CBS domain-containing protein
VSTITGYDRLTVASAMHCGVVTCRPETPLAKVAHMMAGHHIHSVVMWSEPEETDEDGTLWGVVSDLDLARAIAAGDAEVTAQGASSTRLFTVDQNDSVRRAAELMVEHGVAHLVVVKRGRPVGVISTFDLARMLADEMSQ